MLLPSIIAAKSTTKTSAAVPISASAAIVESVKITETASGGLGKRLVEIGATPSPTALMDILGMITPEGTNSPREIGLKIALYLFAKSAISAQIGDTPVG